MARFERLEFDHELQEGLPGPDPAGNEPEANRDQLVWMHKADEHRRRGLHENALRYYSRALELDKSLTAGWLGQVQMLVHLGEYPEAELWARKSLEIFKGHGDLMAARRRRWRGSAIGRRRWSSPTRPFARKEARLIAGWCGASYWSWPATTSTATASTRPSALTATGSFPSRSALIYLHHEQPSKGLLRARQAVEMSPQNFYAWFVEGQCEQALGFDRPAEESYRRVLELSPRHVDANRKLAEIANQGWSLSKGLRRLIGRT